MKKVIIALALALAVVAVAHPFVAKQPKADGTVTTFVATDPGSGGGTRP